MRLSRVGPLAAALMLLASAMGAQQEQRPQGGGTGEQRAQLEARLRQRLARVVQQRIGLTDEQMARLAPTSLRHTQQRRALQTEERAARIALRRALQNPDRADSAEVSRLLQRLVDAQKRRVALLEAEQRDLAAIMTPIQRARYMALQEQLRRQIEQRRDRSGAPPPRRRPPG